MNPLVTELMNAGFRWIHIIAGIMWIGLLYYFNFMNGAITATFDAETKQKVVPELMPRVLYWFRWGAAYTWISGFLLLGVVIYMGGVALPGDSDLGIGAALGIGIGMLLVGWVLYDFFWKAMAKQEKIAAAISWAAAVGIAFGLSMVFSSRAVYIHIGSLFGTLMAANVWMRIWPAQRRIIAAIKAGNAPEAADGAMAKLRSKHNTYMSVPLIYFMISSHFPSVFGHDLSLVWLGLIILAGWGMTKLMYMKGGSAAPTRY